MQACKQQACPLKALYNFKTEARRCLFRTGRPADPGCSVLPRITRLPKGVLGLDVLDLPHNGATFEVFVDVADL